MNEDNNFNIGANIAQDEPAVYNSYYNHKQHKSPWALIIGLLFIVIIVLVSLWMSGVFTPMDRQAEYDKLSTKICAAAVKYSNDKFPEYKSKSGKILYISIGKLVEGNMIEANLVNYLTNEPITSSEALRLEVLPSGAFKCYGFFDPSKDKDKPVITLKGEATIYGKVGVKATDPGATALDGYDGDISENISRDGNVNTSQAGTYVVNYTVSDRAGNLSEIVHRTYIIQ